MKLEEYIKQLKNIYDIYGNLPLYYYSDNEANAMYPLSFAPRATDIDGEIICTIN